MQEVNGKPTGSGCHVNEQRADALLCLLQFLQVAADLAASNPRLAKKFPAILMVNNPTLENVRKLYDLTLLAGRQPKIVLQVRRPHSCHAANDLTQAVGRSRSNCTANHCTLCTGGPL